MPPLPNKLVTYRGVPGLPNHEVGSDGSIWTKSKFGPKEGEKRGLWRRMKPVADKDGYLRVTLCVNGKKLQPTGVHTYVLQAFVGPCPVGMEACHGDGNPANNRLLNLRWDTKSKNNLEKRRHGTDQSGERNGNRKLTLEDVRYIRKFTGVRGYRKVLVKKFGVSLDTVFKIQARKLWASQEWQ